MRYTNTFVILLSLVGCVGDSDAKAKDKAKKEQAAAGTAIGAKIPQFTADAVTLAGDKSTTGKFDSHKTKRLVAYVFVGTSCPTSKAYAVRMHELETAYAGKVDFVFIYPNKGDTSDGKLAYHKSIPFAAPLVDDQGARIAKLVAATKTSEVLLVSKDGTLLYRGAIDNHRDPAKADKKWVALAIDEHLAGKTVTTPTTDVHA